MRIIGETGVAFSPEEALDLVMPLRAVTLRRGLISRAYARLCVAGLADRMDSGWWAGVSRIEHGGYQVAFHNLRKPGSPEAVPGPRRMKCPRCGWEGDLLLNADGVPDGVIPSQGGEHENHKKETEAHDQAGTSSDHDEGAGAGGPKVLA